MTPETLNRVLFLTGREFLAGRIRRGKASELILRLIFKRKM
jgi:hypothetical protein